MADNATVKSGKGYGGRAFQIVASLLLFAGFVVFLFVPKAIGDSSLWSMILDVFKGGYAETAFLRYSLFGIVGFYAVLLVCTVISLFTKAGSALACNYIKAFAALAAFAVFAYALNKDIGASFSDILLDDKTFVAVNAITCSAALALAGTVVLNFVAYKGHGVVKFIFALFAAGFFVFAKDYTFLADTTFTELFGLELGDGIVAMITGYAFTALAWAIIVNMALAVLTMMLPRTSILDLVRSVIVFVLAALALVMGGVYASFNTLFDNIGIVGVTGVALAQLIYAIVVVAVLHAKNKKREAAADAEDDSPFIVGTDNQMAFKGLEAPAAAQAAPEAAPAAETFTAETVRPEPQFAQDAAAANDAFEDAAQISIEDIAEETAKEEEETYEAEAAPEEKEFDFEQAKFDGKFNRAYAEFAEREEKKQQNDGQSQQTQQQAQQQPFYGYGSYNYQQYQQTPPPYYNGYAQQQQQPYQQPMQGGYYNAGFVPDMFISSLTPAERDEFDRLFISRIYGENKRLPAYQIGGDNREFFTATSSPRACSKRSTITATRSSKYNT